jgi:hypothetical protein
MLAYLFWHRPAAGVERVVYERELVRLHRSLAMRPPSGFRGSAAFRAPEPPWLEASGSAPGEVGAPGDAGGGGGAGAAAHIYEDWYLIDGWGALGVLEEAAVARGHVSVHDAVARHSVLGAGAVYRLSEGQPALAEVCASLWVSRPGGPPAPALADLLADGMDPRCTSMWRRCLALGPAPELCLLSTDADLHLARTGVAAGRLPSGWSAVLAAREPLEAGSFSPKPGG